MPHIYPILGHTFVNTACKNVQVDAAARNAEASTRKLAGQSWNVIAPRKRNEVCEVRGTKWPSYRTGSAEAFLWKFSVQEVPMCNVKIQECSACWKNMSLGSSSSQI
jgi:hypothetical protein